MRIYDELLTGKSKLSVIGLGYVGIPLAVAFSKRMGVVGLDINEKKIELYKSGVDPTKEVGDEAIKNCTVEFVTDGVKLKEAKFHIIAVPTPITKDKMPDLIPLEDVCRLLGGNLTKGSYVVFESTVYPGVTEDICVPILEKESSLKKGVDFKVGYSPERINPSDTVHRLENIVKIVSASDGEALESIADIYGLIIKAGVHKAPTIKVAEAAKVIENSQRDLNIAFINDMAIAFHRMGIDTADVIDAMNTKWNALGFKPGLVGGHCISVDPYYFLYMSEKLGYHSSLVADARQINEHMGQFVVDNIIRKLINANKKVKECRIAVLGVTFKENCPDPRNSKVMDIIDGLKTYGIDPVIIDPAANKQEIKSMYGIELCDIQSLEEMDCLVFAVAHDEFRELTTEELLSFFADTPNEEKVVIDVKGMLDKSCLEGLGCSYWRL